LGFLLKGKFRIVLDDLPTGGDPRGLTLQQPFQALLDLSSIAVSFEIGHRVEAELNEFLRNSPGGMER